MADHSPTPASGQDITGSTAGLRASHDTRHTGDLTGRRLGGYNLGKLLGRGGMADVYWAYDATLMRDVAVKVLAGPLAQDPNYVARFQAEARRVAALNHPHLIPVYHAGEENVDGQRHLYLVMPLLHESLEELLAREGKQPPAKAVGLVIQVASGLDAAHRHGLVHRDVKPGNILLDAEGQALLADFGLAREVRRGSRDVSQQPWGTPEYMAPEQLHGDTLNQRTDIYALGVVLYELLTGTRPFDGQTAYDIAARALTAPLQPPSTHDPGIPAALDRVVLTALSREPGDRYPNMAEFALALRRAVGQQSEQESEFPSAVTVPLPDRFWSSAQSLPGMVQTSRRRSMRWLSLSVLAMVLLTAGLAGTLLVRQHSGRDVHQATDPPRAGATVQGSPTGSGSLGSIQTPQSTSDVTPQATLDGTAGTTSTPSIRPTSTATAYVTTLTIAPTPLVLTPIYEETNKCSATQTVTNNIATAVGWAWQKPAVSGFHFQIDGRPSVSWPTATTNAPPGGKDTVVVTADCKSQPTSYTILVKDSLGGQYSFTMTLQ